MLEALLGFVRVWALAEIWDLLFFWVFRWVGGVRGLRSDRFEVGLQA